MELTFNTFSLTFIGSGIVTSILGFFVIQRKGQIVKLFALLMFLIALWAMAYGFELASKTLGQMLFWIKVEYIGISFLPAIWFCFIVKFIGHDSKLTPVRIIALLIIPFISLFLVWTNQYHHLHYATVSVDSSGPFPLLDIEPGIWYRINTAFFYLLLAWGIFLLVSRFKSADKMYQRQNSIILIAALVPWFINLMYILGFRPLNHIDLTPYAFVVTATIIGIGLLKFRLFNVVPIAHEKVIEAMEDGLLVLNSGKHIVDINQKMKQILGIAKEDIIGHKLIDVFPAKHPVHQLEGNDDKITFEANKDDNGLEVYELSSSSLFKKKETAYSGSLIIFKDVSRHINAKRTLENQAKELQNLNSLKDKLFSIIAHDLRGPLASLTEILKLNDDGLISESDIKSLLPMLSENLGQTSGLLENLLSWSRSQLQGESISPVLFDLREIVIEKLNLFEKKAEKKGVELVNQVTDSHIIYADRDMIELVIRNLLSNALKFTRSGDKIIVSAYYYEGHCTVSIKDTGIGISLENQKKLFGLETFSTKGTHQEQGTGLGLPLCKDFVEKNGGKIWLNSEEGKGSEFLFKLPANEGRSPVKEEVSEIREPISSQ